MRFAIISTMDSDPWGGSEALWAAAAERLVRDGHDVFASVRAWAEPRPALEALAAAGVRIWQRPLEGPSTVMRLAQRSLAKVGVSWPQSAQHSWLKAARPDLVCVSNGNVISGAPWMRLSRELGLRYTTLAQANAEQFWPSDAEAAELRTLFANAARCFFVAAANQRLFESQIGERLLNAEVVWQPVKVARDAAPEWPPGDIRLACVARLHPPSKGQDLLIEVLAQPKWLQRPVTVTLFGSGPQEDTLRRLVASRGLGERITFGGHVGEVEQIWRSHHALVLPSRYEGLPLTLIEAFFCGRPAIVTDVAGNSEFVEEGLTGFIAEAPAAALLDGALERAWQRRADWPGMGREAAARVRKVMPPDAGRAFADRLIAIARGG